jgi:hypothetical protein
MCFPQMATSDAYYNPLKMAVVAAQRYLCVVWSENSMKIVETPSGPSDLQTTTISGHGCQILTIDPHCTQYANM